MRISDWSSDVCSSDLAIGFGELPARQGIHLPCHHRFNIVASQLDDTGIGTQPEIVVGIGNHLEHGDYRQPLGLAEHRQLAIAPAHQAAIGGEPHGAVGIRSEEHTSELQSLMRISYAVFCLTKKTKKN